MQTISGRWNKHSTARNKKSTAPLQAKGGKNYSQENLAVRKKNSTFAAAFDEAPVSDEGGKGF